MARGGAEGPCRLPAPSLLPAEIIWRGVGVAAHGARGGGAGGGWRQALAAMAAGGGRRHHMADSMAALDLASFWQKEEGRKNFWRAKRRHFIGERKERKRLAERRKRKEERREKKREEKEKEEKEEEEEREKKKGIILSSSSHTCLSYKIASAAYEHHLLAAWQHIKRKKRKAWHSLSSHHQHGSMACNGSL